MDIIQVIARLLHIGFGVVWVGGLLFVHFFLEPSVRAAGPEGGKVMQELQKRKFTTFMPIVALVTIISGLYMYGRLAGGSMSNVLGSPFGVTLTVGAVAAIVAFIIGVSLLRPAMMKVAGMAASLQSVGDENERKGIASEMTAIRDRARSYSLWVSILLIIALIAMATARYI